MKESPLDFDYDFEIPDFDSLLDDIDLDFSLDGIDLDFSFDLSEDLPSNRERTEKKDLLKIVEPSTNLARDSDNPYTLNRSFWSP